MVEPEKIHNTPIFITPTKIYSSVRAYIDSWNCFLFIGKISQCLHSKPGLVSAQQSIK